MQEAFNRLCAIAQAVLIAAAQRYVDGEITKEQFAAIFLLLLLQQHTVAVVIGRLHAGGYDQPYSDHLQVIATDADKEAAQSAVDTQAPYLNGFAADIADGRYESQNAAGETVVNAAAIERRAASYAVALRATANQAWVDALPDDTRFYWVLGSAENHCADCPVWAADGPYTADALPAIPGDGSSECGIGCRCDIETEAGHTGLQFYDADDEATRSASGKKREDIMNTRGRQLRRVEFRASSISENTIRGTSAVIGNLDSYNTVIFPGFFDGVIPDFLSRGFMADSHDWDKPIGMPTKAVVVGRELQTEAEFHSDPASQVVRTRCMERQARNLAVGLSIGFGIAEQQAFANGQALLDFAKKRGCDMGLFDVAGIAAHTTKCAGLLRCSRLYEYSPVAVPANDEALAADVRGRRSPSGSPVTRGAYLGDDIEEILTIAALERLMSRLFYRCIYSAICGTWDYDYDEDDYVQVKPTLGEALAMIAGGCDEFKAMALKVVEAIMSGAEDADTPEAAMTSLRALFGDPETRKFADGARAARSFETELDAALAAVKSCIERAGVIQSKRSNDGRSISGDRVKQLRAMQTEIGGLLSAIPTPVDPDSLRLAARARASSAYLLTVAS